MDDEVSEVVYLGEVNHKHLNSWEAEINMNENPIVRKLDTGAEACVISDKLAWLKNQLLKYTNRSNILSNNCEDQEAQIYQSLVYLKHHLGIVR